MEKVCSYSEKEPIRDGESGKTDGWRWQSPSNLFIFSRDSSFQMFSNSHIYCIDKTDEYNHNHHRKIVNIVIIIIVKIVNKIKMITIKGRRKD